MVCHFVWLVLVFKIYHIQKFYLMKMFIFIFNIYVLIIGMHSVSDTYATSLFELIANPPDNGILLHKKQAYLFEQAFLYCLLTLAKFCLQISGT